MKISITKTVLGAMPTLAWREFCRFCRMESLDVYTPTQRIAAVCLRYYLAACSGGHAEFFYSCRDANGNEVTQALVAIGAPVCADIFAEAVEKGAEDDYKSADLRLEENIELLHEAIRRYWIDNTNEFYEIVDEDYKLTPTPLALVVGVAEAGVFILLMIIFSIRTPGEAGMIIPTFFSLSLLGLYLIAYHILWRVTVKKDSISRRLPFVRKRTIQIDEISRVKKFQGGIVLYAHGKRFVTVEKSAGEYLMLWEQLRLAGKISEEPEGDFVLGRSVENIMESALFAYCGIFMFIWTFARTNPPASMNEKIFFTGLLPLIIWFSVYRTQGKITVLENSITVKKLLRKEAEYRFSDITMAETDKKNLFIYAHGKRAAKISLFRTDCYTLINRLQKKNVPFRKRRG